MAGKNRKRIRLVKASEVRPTIFENRESRRLITKEREGSERMSLHLVRRWELGLSPPVKYDANDEIMYMIDGDCMLVWDGHQEEFQPGTAAYIPAGNEYRILARTPCELIAVLSPPRTRSEWKTRPNLISLEPE